MATEEEVQEIMEGLSGDIESAIAPLALDQAIQVLQGVQDRITSSVNKIRDDYQLAVSRDVDMEAQAPPPGRARNDMLDEGGQPVIETVQPIQGPADLMDLEREVGKQ